MESDRDNNDRLGAEIRATASKLEELESEIAEIGEPVSIALRHRLEALQIEERALQRNFGELGPEAEANSVRLQKIERLLHHIEAAELSLQHDADFLHQGNLTSLEAAIRSGSKLFNKSAGQIKKAVGDHHVLPPQSPFVNRTHEGLSSRYHLPNKDINPPAE